MRIINPNGVWLKNTGMFPLYDPEANVVLPAGEEFQALHTDWAKGQPTIVLGEGPQAAVAAAKPKEPVVAVPLASSKKA